MFIFVFCLGTFLVNSLPALVLFNSGASWLFVLLSFSRSFDVIVRVLECPLWFSITNEHKVSSMSIFHDCVLDIYPGCISW